MMSLKKIGTFAAGLALLLTAFVGQAQASEIDLNIPMLDVDYNIFGYALTGSQILFYGLGICLLGFLFGLYEFIKIKKLPAHKSMLDVSNLIYSTCKFWVPSVWLGLVCESILMPTLVPLLTLLKVKLIPL